VESGILAISLPGRETGIIGRLYRILMEHTAQTPLLLLLKTGTIMPFVETILKPIHFDASYVKLREVSYRLSDKWTKAVKMQNISIGLVENNLALWTKVQTLTQKLKP
jgi:hypothetical protein